MSGRDTDLRGGEESFADHKKRDGPRVQVRSVQGAGGRGEGGWAGEVKGAAVG